MDRDFPVEWQMIPIEECMSAIIDYRGKSPRKTAFGVPLVTAKVVKGGRIEYEDGQQEYIAFEDYEKWMRRGMPEPGDIVMTTEAPLGEIAQLDQRRVALAQRLITLRGKPGLLDNTFLKYLMFSDFVQNQLRARASGTTVIGIRQAELRKVTLALPPIRLQRRIAEILGRLDDKIEVNRRINRTLERMAQALYKHWFVDFGPFQDGEFVECEVGLVPKGWEVVTVGDVCQVVNGATPSTKVAHYWDSGDICWATPTDMTALTASVIFDTSKKITRLGLANCSATLLPVGSVLVTSRATIGISAINFAPMATNQGFKSLICGPRATNHFMLLTMKNRVDEMIGRANGTTFLEINSTNFKAMELVLPPQEVMAAFDRQVKPYFDQIYANQRENAALAATRDYLLPRLLVGEIM
jgi:type I restriction enzyme S subunit